MLNFIKCTVLSGSSLNHAHVRRGAIILLRRFFLFLSLRKYLGSTDKKAASNFRFRLHIGVYCGKLLSCDFQ